MIAHSRAIVGRASSSERAIDQKHHPVDFFAESGEHHGIVGQDPGIVAPEFNAPVSRLYSLPDRLSLSWDGTTLYFNSNRPGGFNAPAYLTGDI